jgi:hypothetical protein
MFLYILSNPDCIDDASPGDEEGSLIGIEAGAETFTGDLPREKS